jgi:hypothetical protein
MACGGCAEARTVCLSATGSNNIGPFGKDRLTENFAAA